LLERVELCLEPALRIDRSVEVAPALAMASLIEAGERLAATDELPGPSRLWAGEEGDALATRLSEVQSALPLLPDQRHGVLPGLLDAVLEGAVVRSRRALRGRDGTEHPRVFIWGLLEARLQTADVMVLGGLAEGVWPPASDPGAWLSRPMRATVGLPSPEEIIGQAAHDFVSCAAAAPTVVLSCPRRREGAPVVPARWLTRLETLLAGQDMRLPQHPAITWVRALDQPADGPRPVRPPRPCPPVALRPRRLSVTEIETWLRDPYAIHARHVLKLRKLKPLDEATDAADYGSLVHAGMHHFLEEFGPRWPADAAAHLRRAMARALAEAELREALVAWWTPRLERIADWVAAIETARRSEHPPVALLPEADGTLELPRPGGLFRLAGRADRIERRRDGGLAILDYKTGTPPSQREVDAGLAPQLLLEAAMAQAAAFGDAISGAAAELSYWHMTGGFQAGELRTLFKSDAGLIAAAVDEARDALCALIDAYDAPDRCYLSQPQPGMAPRFSDYAQLARVAEWAAAGDDA
jgi:ATP-dependent helicase/nuclease subunit B